ncbi:MAG: hypothetical protein K6E84_07675 [Lachnospiraceae bacterium]|nr:hypothetical protein [Lachnospiraceae bacterium]
MEFVVIWIVIIFFIMKYAKKNAADKKSGEALSKAAEQELLGRITSSSGSGSAANLKSVHTMRSDTYKAPGRPASGPSDGARKAVAAAGSATAASVAKKSSAPATKKEGKSTTEMLAEKAKQDQIEHRKEQYEHAQFEKKYYNDYHYARRYLLGDPIAASDKLVYCPNCAAENLIKIHENPGKYNCYFCREKLQ